MDHTHLPLSPILIIFSTLVTDVMFTFRYLSHIYRVCISVVCYLTNLFTYPTYPSILLIMPCVLLISYRSLPGLATCATGLMDMQGSDLAPVPMTYDAVNMTISSSSTSSNMTSAAMSLSGDLSLSLHSINFESITD